MSFSGTLGIIMGKEFACKRRVHFCLNSLKRVVVVVIVLLFYVHGKHQRSCRDGQLSEPHFSWAGLDLLSG